MCVAFLAACGRGPAVALCVPNVRPCSESLCLVLGPRCVFCLNLSIYLSSRAAALFASSCGIHALTASASAAFSRLLLIRRLLLLQHLYELPEGRWFAAKGQHLCPLLLRHRPDGGIVRRGSSRLLLLSFVSRELFRAHLEGSDFRTFSEHVRTSHNTIPPLPALDPPLLIIIIIFFFHKLHEKREQPGNGLERTGVRLRAHEVPSTCRRRARRHRIIPNGISWHKSTKE